MDTVTQVTARLTAEYDAVAPIHGHDHAIRCMTAVRRGLVEFAISLNTDPATGLVRLEQLRPHHVAIAAGYRAALATITARTPEATP